MWHNVSLLYPNPLTPMNMQHESEKKTFAILDHYDLQVVLLLQHNLACHDDNNIF